MIDKNLIQVKSLFFTSAGVISATDMATRKRLSKFGAFVRRSSRSSIRKVGKKGTSARPGTPPKSRTGLLKDNIFFLFDPAAQSVVVGPIRLNGRSRQSIPATEALEVGGQVRRGDGTTAVYAAFPYMKPAFDKELAGADQLFKNAITAN